MQVAILVDKSTAHLMALEFAQQDHINQFIATCTRTHIAELEELYSIESKQTFGVYKACSGIGFGPLYMNVLRSWQEFVAHGPHADAITRLQKHLIDAESEHTRVNCDKSILPYSGPGMKKMLAKKTLEEIREFALECLRTRINQYRYDIDKIMSGVEQALVAAFQNQHQSSVRLYFHDQEIRLRREHEEAVLRFKERAKKVQNKGVRRCRTITRTETGDVK